MKPFEQQNHYELLEVSVSASQEELNAAYARALEFYSPDSVAVYALVDPQQIESLRKRLSDAMASLSDPALRTEYDRSIGVASTWVNTSAPSTADGLAQAARTASEPASVAAPAAETVAEAAKAAPEPEAVAAPVAEAPVATAAPEKPSASEPVPTAPEASSTAFPSFAVSYVPRSTASLNSATFFTSFSIPVRPPAPSAERAEAPASTATLSAEPASSPAATVEPVRAAEPSRVEAPVAKPEAAPEPTRAGEGEAKSTAEQPVPVTAVDAVEAGSDEVTPARLLAHKRPASQARPGAPSAPPGTKATPPPLPSRGARFPRATSPAASTPASPVASEPTRTPEATPARPAASPPAETALVPAPRPSPASRELPRPKLDIPADAEFTGELLRRVRESKGYSLHQLAERTRISKLHLENVEADHYTDLPAPVYLRGILMNLARELGLDPLRVSRSYLLLASKNRR